MSGNSGNLIFIKREVSFMWQMVLCSLISSVMSFFGLWHSSAYQAISNYPAIRGVCILLTVGVYFISIMIFYDIVIHLSNLIVELTYQLGWRKCEK